MIRHSIPVLALLALAACATPREACIGSAQSDVRNLTREISVRERNLARGYQLVTVRDTQLALTTCLRRDRDGTTVGYPCQKPVVTRREEPVAIDASEERARLAGLRADRDRAVAAADVRIRQCQAQYPAET